MNNEKEQTNTNPAVILENLMDMIIFLLFLVTLVSAGVLLTTGTYELLRFPTTYKLLYFAGAGASLLFHWLMRISMSS